MFPIRLETAGCRSRGHSEAPGRRPAAAAGTRHENTELAALRSAWPPATWRARTPDTWGSVYRGTSYRRWRDARTYRTAPRIPRAGRGPRCGSRESLGRPFAAGG